MASLASNIGLTVVDKRWKNRGVVVGVTEGYDNQLMIRSWSDELNRYIYLTKRYDLIGHIPESQNVNEKDPEYRKMLRGSCLELALMTGDKEWYEELQKMV